MFVILAPHAEKTYKDTTRNLLNKFIVDHITHAATCKKVAKLMINIENNGPIYSPITNNIPNVSAADTGYCWQTIIEDEDNTSMQVHIRVWSGTIVVRAGELSMYSVSILINRYLLEYEVECNLEVTTCVTTASSVVTKRMTPPRHIIYTVHYEADKDSSHLVLNNPDKTDISECFVWCIRTYENVCANPTKIIAGASHYTWIDHTGISTIVADLSPLRYNSANIPTANVQNNIHASAKNTSTEFHTENNIRTILGRHPLPQIIPNAYIQVYTQALNIQVPDFIQKIINAGVYVIHTEARGLELTILNYRQFKYTITCNTRNKHNIEQHSENICPINKSVNTDTCYLCTLPLWGECYVQKVDTRHKDFRTHEQELGIAAPKEEIIICYWCIQTRECRIKKQIQLSGVAFEVGNPKKFDNMRTQVDAYKNIPKFNCWFSQWLNLSTQGYKFSRISENFIICLDPTDQQRGVALEIYNQEGTHKHPQYETIHINK
jgi:hypothetical protein